MFGHKEAHSNFEVLKQIDFDDVTEHDLDFDLSRKPLVNSIKGNLAHPLLSAGA